MLEHRIILDNLPDLGQEFSFPEQEFWTERFDAFAISARIGREIEARAHVSQQDEDALVRGSITGSVWLACDRCAEEFEFELAVAFDEFEAKAPEVEGEETRIAKDKGVHVLDMGSVLWEQFMLALPMRPICEKGCKGVCPECGANLNDEPCSCVRDEADPRLAVFKGLKVK